MGRFLLAGAAHVSGARPPPFVPPAVPSAFLGAAPERGSVCGLSRDDSLTHENPLSGALTRLSAR